MVSTRQMTITTGPGAIEESFDPSTNTSTIPRPVTIARPAANNDEPPKQTIFLLDLPVEILDKIFSYVGYKKTSQMRIVSQPMNQICSVILNSTFQKLQTQMLNRFQNIKRTMPRRESARRFHPLAAECDIVETCYMRLSLLQMTFGKHIERKHCCFFPGGILDEVYNILNYIRTTPKLGRPYKITEELFDLSTMAMEYFKENLEHTLPEIAYFSKDFLDFSCTKNTASSTRKSNNSSLPSPPQSNMVLRKGIRKIKQGMKRYNNQLTVLRSDLRFCKRKSTDQTKQIVEMQKLLAEQQKQTLDYAARLDENDKKNEEMSMKISTLLQEANKCKTELQYWRSKSPATQISNPYAVPLEDVRALVLDDDQSDNIHISPEIDIEKQVQINENTNDLTTTSGNDVADATLKIELPIESIDVINNQDNAQLQQNNDDLIIDVPVIPIGSPKMNSKRKLELDASASCSNELTRTVYGSGSDMKKARRVQNKVRCQTSNVNSSKTRSK